MLKIPVSPLAVHGESSGIKILDASKPCFSKITTVLNDFYTAGFAET